MPKFKNNFNHEIKEAQVKKKGKGEAGKGTHVAHGVIKNHEKFIEQLWIPLVPVGHEQGDKCFTMWPP